MRHLPGRLDATGLYLATRDCVLDKLSITETLRKLWREPPEAVRSLHDAINIARMDEMDVGPRHGRLAEMLRAHERPIRGRRAQKGLTVSEAALRLQIPEAAFTALAEAHGYLSLAPFGRTQARRLMTDKAIEAGIGWNVDATRRRIKSLEGHHRATVFPVFAEEQLERVAWSLDWPGIVGRTEALPNKKARLRFLLAQHSYLPDTVVASLAAVDRGTVARGRKRHQDSHASPEPLLGPVSGLPQPLLGGLLQDLLSAAAVSPSITRETPSA